MTEQGYSGGTVGPRGEGLMSMVWRECGRGEVPSVGGSKQRQVVCSRTSKACWVSGLGWSTVASSGEAKPGTGLCSAQLGSPRLLERQLLPVLLLAEF